MKFVQRLVLVFTIFFASFSSFAQKDSVQLQRKARKFVREGNELYKQEKYTDASVSYQKALNNNGQYGKAAYNLGNALYQNKNYREAIPQYELKAKTAKDKDTKAEAYHNIGNAMMEMKDYQGAVNAYKNSLRNNPNDDETRYNLAVAQQMLDDQNKQQQNKDKNKNNNKNNKDKKDKKDQKDQND